MEPTVDNMKMQKECTGLRDKIKEIGDVVKTLVTDQGIMSLSDEMLAESKANVMLSYRHLEDARMRIGKVMQCLQGGVSIFDKPEKERANIVDAAAKAVVAPPQGFDQNGEPIKPPTMPTPPTPPTMNPGGQS